MVEVRTARAKCPDRIELGRGEFLVMKRFIRRTAAAAGVTLLVAGTIAGGAVAQTSPSGLGDAVGQTRLARVTLGELLGVDVLTESSTTVLDSALGTPIARERLAPLDIASSLFDGVSVPAVEVSSTGAEQATTTPGFDIGALSPVDGLLGGAIAPAQLRALLDASGAQSSLFGSVLDLSVLGGLVDVGDFTAELGSAARTTLSEARRGVALENVELLDLAGLLQFLGIGLDALPVDTVLGLVAGLGLPVGDLDLDSVPGLLADLTALDNALTDLVAEQTLANCESLPDLPLPLPIDCSDLVAAIATIQAEIDVVQGVLAPLLEGALDLLIGAPLLSFDGVELSVVAEAKDTVANSVADVTATIGGVRVGAVALDGVDLGATAEQIAAVVDGVLTQLDGVLATVHPDLAGIVGLDLVSRATSVSEADGYVRSTAGVVGARLAVTPPDVCAILDDLAGETIGSVLDQVGGSLPTLPTEVTDVLDALGLPVGCQVVGVAGAVGRPLQVPVELPSLAIEALSVSETARFRVPATPQTPNTPQSPGLATTGGESTMLLLIAGAGLLAVVAGRRWLGRSAA
jgi:hypothetical protein